MDKPRAYDAMIVVPTGGNAQMTIPTPGADPHLEWSLRYGSPEAVRFIAASVVESFDYLLSDNINMTEATRRLRLLRAARREHVSGVLGPVHQTKADHTPSDGQESGGGKAMTDAEIYCAWDGAGSPCTLAVFTLIVRATEAHHKIAAAASVGQAAPDGVGGKDGE